MTEDEWTHHNPAAPTRTSPARPVSRSAILIASAVLVLALAIVVVGVWRMVTG